MRFGLSLKREVFAVTNCEKRVVKSVYRLIHRSVWKGVLRSSPLTPVAGRLVDLEDFEEEIDRTVARIPG